MAKTPSVTKLVDFESLFRADNVRTDACTRLPDIVASLKLNGFKPNHPLVLSAKPDGRYLVLCGNRRTQGLEFLRDNEPENFKAALAPSGGKVPAVIHTGLTAEEEIVLRIDHGPSEDRVPLDEWSQFLAIKQLLRAYPGDSQAKIAEKLGIVNTKGKKRGEPNRSFVQGRVNLARLPEFVQEEYRKLCVIGADATPVRWTDVKGLYASYNKEFAHFPDGDGPEFRTAWDKVLHPAPEEPSTDDDSPKPESLSPDAAKARAQNSGSRLIKRVLLSATGQGGDWAVIDAQILKAETDSEILGMIAELLGVDEFANLVNRARDNRVAIEAAQAEANKASAPVVAESVG